MQLEPNLWVTARSSAAAPGSCGAREPEIAGTALSDFIGSCARERTSLVGASAGITWW